MLNEMMKPYTVLLLYPPRLQEDYPDLPETYLAWVKAKNPKDAEIKAKKQVGRANCTTGQDFDVLFMAEGTLADVKPSLPLRAPK